MPTLARRKLACKTETVSEAMRAKSDFARGTGYAPFYHAFLADLPRLCSGASCWALVMAALTESLGRARDKGEAAPEWTRDLDKEWLVAVCRTERRTIDRDLKYLETSGMAQVRTTIKGMVCIRLCYRDWPNLPDYTQPIAATATNLSALNPEDAAEPVCKLLKTPCHVKAGGASEAIDIEQPVTSFRLRAAGDTDIAFTAEIRNGRFTVTTKAVSVSNDLQSSARHSKPETGKGEQKAKGEQEANKYSHPRADELARLFDPILLRSCGRSLSADQVAFDQALNALGDLPHDFLVKFVIQRAERPISSPKVCASILKEALANWRKGEALPEKKPVAHMTNSERVEHMRRLEAEQKVSGRH